MAKLELNLDSKLSEVFAYEESRAVFDRVLPGMRQKMEGQASVMGFSVRKVISFAGGAIPQQAIDMLDQNLQALEIEVEEDMHCYTEDYPLTEDAKIIVKEGKKHSIKTGAVMRDTEGKRIQAHGGAVFYEDGVYYLYGENKDRTDGKCPVWTWGIRAYRSEDMYNWEDMGLIIPPVFDDTQTGMYPERHADRPHIIKNEKTQKYVCWIKQCSEEACFMVLSADAFAGPYKVERERYRPFDIKVGDFDIAVDEESKAAYLYMDADHEGTIGMRLSDDYLSCEQKVSMSYEKLHAPFCREAITVFERNGKKYMVTSGMSGYIPNKSDSAVSNSWEEPFESIGNPHPYDESNSSYNSQISQIFKVPGKKDLYISIADRWVPDYPMNARLADIFERFIANHYDPEKYPITPEENKVVMDSPMLESANISKADYVWLPLSFDGDKVVIDWKDEWSLEDYE